MLSTKFKLQLNPKAICNYRVQRSLSTFQFFTTRYWNILTSVCEYSKISSPIRMRYLIKDLVMARLVSAWTRSHVKSVFRKCRKDCKVREMILRVRQSLFRPKRTLLFTVSAAYTTTEEKPEKPTQPCSHNITDEDMSLLISDLENMDQLAKATLFCNNCKERVTIDNNKPGIHYCHCNDTFEPEKSFEGWTPYMEADDVIIWRKEYKPGGLYAYKVYGRYEHITAKDFAAIQIDGRYRTVWDTAVAYLSEVETESNGVVNQAVLHWEVLWPRFFSNRDYVFQRRHKEFDVRTACLKHMAATFPGGCNETEAETEAETKTKTEAESKTETETENVHSNAKRVGEKEREASQAQGSDNKVYVIVSRSCAHAAVPVTKKAVRVTEYWSHMVVKTLNGPDKPGMEFVLTYYDEPAVGGLPTSVMSWAMGRAGPAFLERMRIAAEGYSAWIKQNVDTTKNIESRPPNKLVTGGPTRLIVVPDEKVGDKEGDKLKQRVGKGGQIIPNVCRQEEDKAKTFEPCKARLRSEKLDSNNNPNLEVHVTIELTQDSSKKLEMDSEFPKKREIFNFTVEVDTRTEMKSRASQKASTREQSTQTGATQEPYLKQSNEFSEPEKNKDNRESCGDKIINLQNSKQEDADSKKKFPDESEMESLENKQDGDTINDECKKDDNQTWWRYIYPFNYFV